MTTTRARIARILQKIAYRISPSPANNVPWLQQQVTELERELLTRP